MEHLACNEVLGVFELETIPLLSAAMRGNAGTSAGQLEHPSPMLFGIACGIVEQWPQPPDSIRERSLADVLNSTLAQASLPPSNRSVLRDVIRKMAGAGGMGMIRRLNVNPYRSARPSRDSTDARSCYARSATSRCYTLDKHRGAAKFARARA
jgi:hypothetical protein